MREPTHWDEGHGVELLGQVGIALELGVELQGRGHGLMLAMQVLTRIQLFAAGGQDGHAVLDLLVLALGRRARCL